MPGSHLEQRRRRWWVTVISNDSGKHFNEGLLAGASVSCEILNLSPLRLVAGVGNDPVPVPGGERGGCRFSVEIKCKGFFHAGHQ